MKLKKWSCGALLALGLAWGQSVSAVEILIELTGIDLTYQNQSLSSNGDALASVDVWIDGVLSSQLTPTDGIYLDMQLNGLSGILAGSSGFYQASGGIFDLFTNFGNIFTDFPSLVDVVFLSNGSEVLFTFLGSVNEVFGSTFSLAPLDADGLIEISLSANIASNSLVIVDGLVSYFTAAGTGEMHQSHQAIAEPWALGVMGLGLLVLAQRRNRGE